LKTVKAWTETSIKLFGILENPRSSPIQVDFTTFGAVRNMAKELSKIFFGL
jgi:hypothetical protein